MRGAHPEAVVYRAMQQATVGIADEFPMSTFLRMVGLPNHASDAIVIMASDMNREKLNDGNGTQLCVICSSEVEINRFFNKLKEGGTITEPLAKMFWGGCYGSLIDQYGKYWSFNYEEAKP